MRYTKESVNSNKFTYENICASLVGDNEDVAVANGAAEVWFATYVVECPSTNDYNSFNVYIYSSTQFALPLKAHDTPIYS
jgi:hypothetical protein